MLSLVLRETLIFIHRFQVEHGTSPTIRELEAGLGIGHGSAQSRQNRLIEKGFLQSLPGKARTLRLRSQAIDYLMAIGEYLSMPIHSNIIPLLGEIAAGYLSDPATESEAFEIEHLDSANHFALRVSGDSMVNAGILNGVVAIFKQVPDGYEPKPGAIVAAYVEAILSSGLAGYFKSRESTLPRSSLRHSPNLGASQWNLDRNDDRPAVIPAAAISAIYFCRSRYTIWEV
jgi:repressor LexA